MAEYNHHPGLPQPGMDPMVGIGSVPIQEKRTKDGQVPKRRGPKPDSKPALTRRQQLNRQAQRTHRERKEAYVKNLEEEVLNLRRTVIETTNQKNRILEMNRILRDILHQAGVPIPPHIAAIALQFPKEMGGLSDSASVSVSASAKSHSQTFGSAVTGNTNTSAGSPVRAPPFEGHGHGHIHAHGHMQAPIYAGPSGGAAGKPTVDQEQAGIDFVLTLERPCMGHLPFLLERTADSHIPISCGHGLMMSCPPVPYSQLSEESPWGTQGVPNPEPRSELEGSVPMHTWQSSKSGLAKLLELSEQFDLDGEITPVQAWRLITIDPRFALLSAEDINKLKEDLGTKVHCFGFGAVVEDFEVRDALENVFSQRSDLVSASA